MEQDSKGGWTWQRQGRKWCKMTGAMVETGCVEGEAIEDERLMEMVVKPVEIDGVEDGVVEALVLNEAEYVDVTNRQVVDVVNGREVAVKGVGEIETVVEVAEWSQRTTRWKVWRPRKTRAAMICWAKWTVGGHGP